MAKNNKKNVNNNAADSNSANIKEENKSKKENVHPEAESPAHEGIKSAPDSGKLLLRIVLIAALAVAVVIAGLWFSGLRYKKTTNGDGTSIKFFGWVDDDGELYRGTLYFSGEEVGTAKLDKSGKLTYSDGTVYVGDLSGGFRNGQGKLTYTDGSVYEGQFLNNEITGNGTFVYSSGDVYQGEFSDGEYNGFGTYKYADGRIYEGYYTDNMRNGQGKMTYADGSWYDGSYVNDARSGQGTYHFSNGDEYVGAFVDDVRTGQGTYTFANGETYTGSFVDGTLNGWGKYTWPSGRVLEGMFENGEYVRTTEVDPEEGEGDE